LPKIMDFGWGVP